MYDGTLTVSDPSLVETFDDMPEGLSAYVVRDIDATPPDWDGIGFVYRLSYSHTRYDDVAIAGDYGDTPTPVETIREAWDRFRDWDMVTRYLRMFHDAVSVDWSSSIDRDGTVLAVVTAAHVDAWGCPAELVDTLAGQALSTYGQWADGFVYGVIVTNDETGEEASLWGVYDDSPSLSYCRQVADELAGEVQS